MEALLAGVSRRCAMTAAYDSVDYPAMVACRSPCDTRALKPDGNLIQDCLASERGQARLGGPTSMQPNYEYTEYYYQREERPLPKRKEIVEVAIESFFDSEAEEED